MKTETIEQFRKRGGTIKICRPAKAKGLYVRKYRHAKHMSNRKEKTENVEVKNEQTN